MILNRSDFVKFLGDDVFFRTTPGSANRHAHARRVLRADLAEWTMSCLPISGSHAMARMAGTDGHRWGTRRSWNWEVPFYSAIHGFQEVSTPHRGRERRPEAIFNVPMQVYRAEGSQTKAVMRRRHGKLPFRYMTGLPSFWTPFPDVANAYANHGEPIWQTSRPAQQRRRAPAALYPDETTLLGIQPPQLLSGVCEIARHFSSLHRQYFVPHATPPPH